MGGFAAGAISGMAGGFSGGLVSGLGNGLLNGQGFGNSLKSGLITGGIGAGIGGVMGGIQRGLADQANGYSFWNGTRTSELVHGTASGLAEYKALAKSYNSSSAADVDELMLLDRMDATFNLKPGDYNLTMTTRTDGKYGMDKNGLYVNLETRNTVAGYTRGLSSGHNSMHISPYVVRADNVTFEALAGHEAIHAYHYYAFPGISDVLTDKVAYRHTYNTYYRNQNFIKANSIYNISVKHGYWGKFPSMYSNIPFIKSPIY